MTVRTRFAPSPTGTPESIHLGFVIRALWNFAYAKKYGGQFILRIEDTDQKRSRKDTESAIFSSLREFGFSWDEGPDIGGKYGPYRQSERLDKYKAAALKLVEKGYAYYDFDAQIREKEVIKEAYESEEELAKLKIRPAARNLPSEEVEKLLGEGKPYVIRVKIPEDKIFEYTDFLLKKKIRVLGKDVPDLILLKSDGFPTYHLAVVVDDLDMEISHVFRGQEWISTTPIHLFLYEGFGKPVPQIGHFTVVLDPRTGKKFSKRDLTGMFGVRHWIDKGYLHEAILNYLMLLGWAPKDNREFFTLDEFVQAFDQDGVQKANPTFNEVKLNWFNAHYIREISEQQLVERVKNFTTRTDAEIAKTLPLVKDRMTTLADFDLLTSFFFEEPKIDVNLFEKVNEIVHAVLTHAIEVLQESWDGKVLEEKARAFCEEKNIKVGDYFMVLRVAITGLSKTPPIWDTMEVIGKEKTLERLKLMSLIKN